eukprot:5541979-Alexandrium_andersonii.AAC.1
MGSARRSPWQNSYQLDSRASRASRAPRAKDCADCGSADCGLGACELAISRPRAPSRPTFVGGFGICANNSA